MRQARAALSAVKPRNEVNFNCRRLVAILAAHYAADIDSIALVLILQMHAKVREAAETATISTLFLSGAANLVTLAISDQSRSVLDGLRAMSVTYVSGY